MNVETAGHWLEAVGAEAWDGDAIAVSRAIRAWSRQAREESRAMRDESQQVREECHEERP